MARKVNPKTKESWYKAIREVGAKGKGVSVTAVRESRGQGSLTDASKYIGNFEAEYPEEFAKFDKPQHSIPQDLVSSFTDAYNIAYNHAQRTVATGQVAVLEREAEKLREDLKVSKEAEQRLQGQIDLLKEQVATLMKERKEQKASQKAK